MNTRFNRSLLARLVFQARPYWWAIAANLLCSLLAAPLALLLPLPLKIVVDSVLGSRPLPTPLRFLAGGQTTHSRALFIALSLLLVTTVLVYLRGLVQWVLATYTGEKLQLDFRSRLFRHAQRLSLAYHDTRGTSDSVYRIQYDASSLHHILVNGITPLLTSAVTLGGMIYVTAMIDRELALIALAVCPLLYVLSGRFAEKIRVQWHEFKKVDSAAMGVVQETLSAVRVVKAFGREDREHERFLRESDEALRKQVLVAISQGVFELAVGLVLAVGTVAVLYVGVSHVRSGKITLGALLLVMGYLAQLYEPLKTFSKKVTDIQSSLVSAERAMVVLDELPEVVEHPGARPLLRSSGRITFRGVSFCYRSNSPVLQDVSFDALPGTRLGIAGRTGAGKTTLVNLLMRFYDPNAGQILLDGIDLRDYKLADLRKQFALVLQEPVLFSSSIAENIAYARPEASHEEIVAAAKAARAHEFIRTLPDGYQTVVGERGMLLSGGERQRISLARAFLKDAPILLLDEPTSSVDIKTEAGIVETMERLMRGRTSLMIAHRLSTLDVCDARIEIEDGRIVRASENVAKSGILAGKA